MTYAVGDIVQVVRSIYDPATEDHPGFLLATPGEKLIVRRLGGPNSAWQVHVSHEDVHDATFGVTEVEIRPYP